MKTVILTIALLLTSCGGDNPNTKDTTTTVELCSDRVLRKWEVEGNVTFTVCNSFTFTCKDTGDRITVSGDVVITTPQ